MARLVKQALVLVDATLKVKLQLGVVLGQADVVPAARRLVGRARNFCEALGRAGALAAAAGDARPSFAEPHRRSADAASSAVIGRGRSPRRARAAGAR